MLKQYLLLLFTGFSFFLKAGTFLYFQNNTSSDVQVSTTSTLSSSYWVNNFSGTSEAWRLKTKVFDVNRNVGITNGSSFYQTTSVVIDGQTISLKLKLTGTFTSSNIWCSASGPGFNHAWFDDYNFHAANFSVNGKDYTLKYQFDFVAGSIYADAYYVLHEVNAFEPDTTELTNPNVLNILTYNLYMLTPPIGSSEEIQRAAIVHNYIHGYDAIILNEVFYNTARNNELIPKLSIEYPFRSAVVDASGYPEDGGVMIFSKWPILDEDQMVYSVCDGSDCLSSKGVMYVKINKLGKPYHIFGTHTQAWPDATSIAVRLQQLGEMYAFMQSQNIPLLEPVIFGGDLNVNKANTNQNLEYFPMLDTLHVNEPTYLGHPYTYDPTYNNYASGTDFEYLDFLFSENTHFCAYSVTNEPFILRHVTSNDDFWDNNSLDLDLSDHYAVHGRFEYPIFTIQANNISVCPNDSFNLSVAINKPATYQWFMNGQVISGADSSTLSYAVAASGVFHCEASYGCSAMKSNNFQVTVNPSPNPATLALNGNNLVVTNATGTISWYKDNVLLTGISGTSYSTCASGDYYVVVNSTNNCPSVPSNTVTYVGTSTSPVITLINDTLYSSVPSGNQWYNGNGSIVGATNNYFSSCNAANYYVKIINGNCTSLASNSIYLDLVPATPTITELNHELHSSAASGNQWYDTNGPILNANADSFTPNASGNYYVIVNNGKCDSEASIVYNYTATGIRDRSNSLGISLLSNPVENHLLSFELLGIDASKITVQIFNAIGQNVWNKEILSISNGVFQLDLKALNSGFYLLNIQQGRNSISRKFLIKD